MLLIYFNISTFVHFIQILFNNRFIITSSIDLLFLASLHFFFFIFAETEKESCRDRWNKQRVVRDERKWQCWEMGEFELGREKWGLSELGVGRKRTWINKFSYGENKPLLSLRVLLPQFVPLLLNSIHNKNPKTWGTKISNYFFLF